MVKSPGQIAVCSETLESKSSQLKNKKIIITGGAGFIGSHLTEYLLNLGNEVIVVDTLLRGNKLPPEVQKNVEFHKTDVRDVNELSKLGKGIDCIFHLAAILGVDIVADNPVATMDTEVQGMNSVALCSLHNNISSIVYASTSGVYGHNVLEQSVTEEISISPKTSYAMAKRYNEVYLGALHEEKGINSIAIRFFNVYGPRQDHRMVIPRFFKQAIEGQPLTVYGEGKQTRDFTWIDDCIKSTTLLADKVKGFEIFNVANQSESTIGELAEQIISVTGSESEISFINAPAKRYDYEVGRRFGSSKKLLDFTGYRPDTKLKDGLQNVYQSLTGDP